MFPTSVEYSNASLEQLSYDPVVGQLSLRVDANGLRSTTVRDGLGRIIEQRRQGGDWARSAWTQGAVHPELRVTTGTGGERRTVYDALGRNVTTWNRRALDGAWVEGRRTYGLDTGQMESQTLPGAPGSTIAQTWRYVDSTDLEAGEHATPGLGRLIEHRNGADAITSYRYQGRAVEWDDPDGNHHRDLVDGRGRLATRREPSVDEIAATVTYSYGPFGHLASVTDVAGNRTEFGRDAFGNLTRWHDPDRGERTFDYDAFGNLWREQHTESEIVTIHRYDELGRPVRRSDFRGGTSETTRWVYDAGPHAAMQLVDTYSPDGVHLHFDYDLRGRRERVVQSAPGHAPAETSVRSRDAIGRPVRILMPAGPGGETVETVHQYGSFGHLQSVRFGVGCDERPDPVTGGTFFDCDLDQEVWRLQDVDDAGRVSNVTHGNGLATLTTFEPTTGRLKRMQTVTALGDQLQDFATRFTPGGSIRARSTLAWDTGGHRTEVLQYDERRRLRWARVREGEMDGPPSPWLSELEIRYDATDNVTYRSDLGGLDYDPGNRPHAVRSAGAGLPTGSVLYDQRGNQVRAGPQRRRFDARGQLERLTDPSLGQLRYGYTANGGRAVSRLQRGDGTTVESSWFGSMYERHRDAGMEATRDTRVYRAYVGRHAAAELRWTAGGDPTVLFLHQDPQGSTTAVSNVTGTITERRAYDAIGRYRDPDWGPLSPGPWEHPGYTGHRTGAEAALGLVNMGARLYDPLSSQMLSPDPRLIPQIASDLNPYSYAWNNPLSFFDPSGTQEVPDQPELGVTAHIDAQNRPGRVIEIGGQPWISVPHFDRNGQRNGASFTPITPAELELLTNAVSELGLTTMSELFEEDSQSAWMTYMTQEAWENWIDQNALPTEQVRQIATALVPLALIPLTAIPLVGETSDVVTVVDPNSSNFDFVMSYLSIGVSLATLGASPNWGAFSSAMHMTNAAGDLGRASTRIPIYSPFRANGGGGGGGGGPITDPGRVLPANAGPTGHISPSEVVGRTPAQINRRARQLGLAARGPDPAGGRGSYIDPRTGQQRILSHPNASPPHAHINNIAGERIGLDGSVVPRESPAAHLTIRVP